MAEQMNVSEGELYPVYFVNEDTSGQTIDVPDGFTDRYRNAAEDWWNCQEILEAAYEAAADARRRARG